MRSMNRILQFLAVVSLCSIISAAQTPKETTASVSGRVTLGGKAAAGITIVATVSNSFFDNKTVAKTATDEDGNYKLTALPAGRFKILPLNKAYLVTGGGPYKEGVNVAEGETITKIDFPLVRGGVVTGRITDAEGHPLIGERVDVVLKDSTAVPGTQLSMLGSSRNQTDDRGVYRIYGLAAGSYRVSVGQAASAGAVSIMGIGGSQYVKTFHPGVQDETKATLLEIKEGTEVKDVDISVGRPGTGFSVAGRIIDSDSGNPVPNLFLGHSPVNEANKQTEGMVFTGVQSDANGKFKLEGIRPGRYTMFTFAAGRASSSYSEPVPFEVSDGDVTGIEIKIRRGATIDGIAVIENNSDPSVAGLLQKMSLYAFIEQKGSGAPSFSLSQVGPDGGFHMEGLAPGKARIMVQGFPTPPKGLTLVRTEVDGLDQPDGFEIAAGAQVKGVRLLFLFGTGLVRGEVKIQNGPIPEGATFNVSIRSPPGSSRRFQNQATLDGRLHFVVEDIPPGTYELVIHTAKGGELLKQSVTVANGVETKVTLEVDLAARKEDPK